MMDLAKHIGALVRENELVIIPGLGGFLTQFHSAKVNAVSKKIESPGRHIAFNSQLKDNDGFLAHSFANKTGMSYKDALQIIEIFSQFCISEMKLGKHISFEKLGVLSMSTMGHIQFSADLSVNYDDHFFGLPDISAQPILRNRSYEPVVQINPQAKEKIRKMAPIYRKVAAVAVPFIALGLIAWFSKGHIKNYYQQSASIVNLDSNAQKENNTPGKTKEISAEDVYSANTTELVSTETETQPIIVQENIESFNGKYHLIGGAFSNKELAEKLIKELESNGFKAYIAGQNNNGLYRVSAGNFSYHEKAVDQLRWYQKHVNSSAWLLTEEL